MRYREILTFTVSLLLVIACNDYTSVPAHADDVIPSASPKVSVLTAAGPRRINIGDTIQYTITVTAPDTFRIEFPSFPEELVDLDIRDFKTSRKTFFGKARHIQQYRLTTYTVGTYTIPQTTVRYRQEGSDAWHEALTDEVTIEVQTLLEKDISSGDIHDIKGPFGLTRPLWHYLLLSVIILCLLGVIAGLIVRKRKKTPPVAPSITAHERANKALEELTRKNLIGQGKIKEYYFELSLIVRRYLEDRFTIKAPEMTTEEFLLYLRDSSTLSVNHKSLLKEFLFTADLVKFARYGPSDTEIAASFEAAKRLIDQTKEERRQ